MRRIEKSRFLFPAVSLSAVLALTSSGCGEEPQRAQAGASTTTGSASVTGTVSSAGNTQNSSASAASTASDQSNTPESGGGSSTGQGSQEGSQTGPKDQDSTTTPDSTSSQGSAETTSTGEKDTGTTEEKDYLWLEDNKDPRVLKWIKDTNAKSRPVLEAQPNFSDLRARILKMVQGEPNNQLPSFAKIGDDVYNFHQDDAHPRGLWRRMSYADYQRNQSNWELLLDVDALAKRDNQPWYWLAPNCLAPSGDRCMVTLVNESTGKTFTSEYDTRAKRFLTGRTFDIPAGEVTTSWIDKDSIYLAADFGRGTTTKTGMPRTIRKLSRGRRLRTAPVIFEGKASDGFVSVDSIKSGGIHRILATRGITRTNYEYSLLDPKTHAPTKLDVPGDSTVGFWGPWMICQLDAQPWSVGGDKWAPGSVLVIDQAAYVAGSRKFTQLFAAGERSFLSAVESTKDYLLIVSMENNRSRLSKWSYDASSGWSHASADLPEYGSFMVEAVSHETSNEYFLTYTDFLTPPTMYVADAATDKRRVLRETQAMFDASNLEIRQYFATSKDGTEVPYFQISKKGMNLDSKNPTIVFGFGGFGVALTSGYRAGVGIGWLEKGGVYALANIRGGGEFGPAWHEAARKSERQRAFDDFIAVGEDLVARKVTSKAHMGAHGDGNGGLLTGVMMTQRPDLWGAIVSQNPILDMQRFHQIGGGSAWISEFGNPGRAQDLEYLLKYSPLHNVKPNTSYPPLFLSSRSVNAELSPAHARKMMAKMTDQRHSEVVYYESTNRDNPAGTSHEAQRAYNAAAIFSFFAKHLGLSQK